MHALVLLLLLLFLFLGSVARFTRRVRVGERERAGLKPSKLSYLTLLAAALPLTATADLKWTAMPPLPDKEGFAGMYAGFSGPHLLAAGGANFPDKKPWEGGTKIWYDTVYALDALDGKEWRVIGKLSHASGYGLSLTTAEGVLCIGGATATGHLNEVLLLSSKNGTLDIKPLPALPQPCANMTGALLERTVFVAGGLAEPTATQTLSTFWSLDLQHLERGWQTLPTWPGKPRMLAIGGATDGSFVIAGGTDLHAGPDGKPVRTYLTDAYQFTAANRTWQKLPDLPQPCVAPPLPCPQTEGGFLVLGGDDGANVNFEPKDKHPGFPHTVLHFDASKRSWTKRNDMPFANVTNPAVQTSGGAIIMSGEARPGVRSPAVWQMTW